MEIAVFGFLRKRITLFEHKPKQQIKTLDVTWWRQLWCDDDCRRDWWQQCMWEWWYKDGVVINVEKGECYKKCEMTIKTETTEGTMIMIVVVVTVLVIVLCWWWSHGLKKLCVMQITVLCTRSDRRFLRVVGMLLCMWSVERQCCKHDKPGSNTMMRIVRVTFNGLLLLIN